MLITLNQLLNVKREKCVYILEEVLGKLIAFCTACATEGLVDG